MLDKIIYINHLNERINFGEGNVIINKNSLRDYQWTYNENFNKISNFKKQLVKNNLEVLVYQDEANNAKRTVDRIFEIIEKDVIARKAGKLIINDYYIHGYFYGMQHKVYLVDGIMKFNLNFITDRNSWIKETVFKYRPSSETGGSGLEYPYDYEYDYLSEKRSTDEIYNSSFMPQHVKILIYGATVNPSIMIGDHEYKVNYDINEFEKIEINTMEKTIKVISDEGVETNIFNYRDLNSYIFEKIPTGLLEISSTPLNTKADITILEERSEPKWV